MSKLKNTLLATGVAISLLGAAAPVVFAQSVMGGQWSYGGHHDPRNWGAFSNYWHPSRSHSSVVIRHSDSRSNRGYAGSDETSYAFIHTQYGEGASFDIGF